MTDNAGGAGDANWRRDDKQSDWREDDEQSSWREDDEQSDWKPDGDREGLDGDDAGPGPRPDETVPDITVELADRRPVFLESTLAGVVAGLCVPAALALGVPSASAIGVPAVVDASTPAGEWAFHLVFATVFGGAFGLLVDSRPFWMYGRGFLGPAVGVAFGAVLWAGVAVVFWPVVLSTVPVPLGFGASASTAVALGSYLGYGALVGTFLNLFALARV